MDFSQVKGPVRYFSWISNVSGLLQFHLTNVSNYRADRIVGDLFCRNGLEDGESNDIFVSLLVDLRDEYLKDASVFTRIYFIGASRRGCG
jgi:hypothetical protein